MILLHINAPVCICFSNLETAKEVLTEENIKLTEDLSRAKSENTDLKEELEKLVQFEDVQFHN